MRRDSRRVTALAFCIAVLAIGWTAHAPAELAPIITHHQIEIGGRTLAYTAEAGRTPIRDVETGEPVGYIFYVAYRSAPRPRKKRPIIFIWNGGPGMPAAILHFEGAGPKRIAGSRLVDNADTWLTDSDLVFVDPVGTGFSRAISHDAQKVFMSNVGDVAATTEFVRSWVLLHGAEDTPLVIAGESYGAGRAGSVAYQLLKRGFNVRGVALVSNTEGLPRYRDQDIIATGIHLGDYAVAELYYKKLPPDLGTTPQTARASAERWARETYIPALRNIDTLSDTQRSNVAAELARRLGLKVTDIDTKTLRITQGDFLGHLVSGRMPYYSDYRILEPFKAPNLEPGVRYIRHELGYSSDLPYLGVESLEDGFAPSGIYPKTVNSMWVHSTVYGATLEQIAQAEAAFEKTGAIGMGRYGPELPGVAEAIQLNPDLKVLVAHGAYDPLGGCSMDAELGRQLTSPYSRAVTFRCYLSGHAIVRDALARALFADDMRALARAALSASGVTAPLLRVRVGPSALSEVTGRGDVDVNLTVPDVDIHAGVPIFSLSVMAPGMRAPQPLVNLTVCDTEGPVPLSTTREDSTEWTATRAVKGDLVVSYRLTLDNSLQEGGGPPVNLRVEGDGFSGSGRMLIAQPSVSQAYRIAITWDLSAMGPEAQGVSTYGDGDVILPEGPVDRLANSIFMAGHLKRFTPTPGGAFSAVWLGDPGFDPQPAMQWTGELHKWMSRFFKDKTEPPYRVFLRYNPDNAGGGVALSHSFLVTYGAGVTGDSLKSILPHEMTHTWTAADFGKWYDEGNAVYYQALLPWRAGLFATERFLSDLNLTAARYFTNPKIDAPDAQIAPHFWDDMSLNVLPYDRGAMYFAVLNGKIRKKSGGSRSVDDLIREMVDRQQAGLPVSENVWVDLLRKELGAGGPAIHRSMMAGGLMLPQSDDFGPCFRRVTEKIRRFELGFAFKSLPGGWRTISTVTPDSEAAKAGLRTGDKVSYKLTTEDVFRDPHRTLSMQVTRDGKTFPVTYLPRGEAVDAYQWERIPGVPDSACR